MRFPFRFATGGFSFAGPSRLSRRGFLGSLLAGGAASLAPAALWSRSVAKAQSDNPRFLIIYGEGGWTSRATFMRPAFAPAAWGHWSGIMEAAVREPNRRDDSAFQFAFDDARLNRSDMSEVLDVFWDHRTKMLAFEGLAHVSSAWDGNGDAHAAGTLACMTAGPSAYQYDGIRSHPAYPSIDQRFLAHLRTRDPAAQSFHFDAHYWRASGADGTHWFLSADDGTGTMVRLPTESDPEVSFRRHFAGVETMPGTEDMRSAMNTAIFGALQEEYAQLEGRLAGDERLRIRSHRSLLGDIEMRLTRPRVECAIPEIDILEGRGAAQWEGDWLAFADMAIAGFGCGLTNVATLSFRGIPPDAYGLPPEAAMHHEYEHESTPGSFYREGGPSDQNVRAEAGMIQRHRYQASLVERVVRTLDETPDAAGGSLLDNTIVLYVNELSHGGHGMDHCPFLVFGGGNLGLRTGQYIKYSQNLPNPWHAGNPGAIQHYDDNQYTGHPHSRLYLTLLRQLGVDIDHIHAPSMEGATEGRRETIDMRSSLSEIL